jgi:hypothetical protein
VRTGFFSAHSGDEKLSSLLKHGVKVSKDDNACGGVCSAKRDVCMSAWHVCMSAWQVERVLCVCG